MIRLTSRTAIQSKGTLLISLPKTWVINTNIQPGEKLSVSMDDDGNLVVEKPKEAADDRTT